jgi:hypothetical protein
MMDWIKKNWAVIAIVAIVVAIVIYNRKKESAYMITGCPEGIIPNPVTGICDNSYSWDQVPTGVFSNRIFRTRNMR